jgi:hypothetical protein
LQEARRYKHSILEPSYVKAIDSSLIALLHKDYVKGELGKLAVWDEN